MSDIANLEAQKKDMQEAVLIRDQILRLSNNSDFRAVFEKEFMEAEAGRLIRMAGDPMLPEKERNDCIQMALATGHIKRFLSAKVQIGNMAEETIHQIDEALEELRAQGEDE